VSDLVKSLRRYVDCGFTAGQPRGKELMAEAADRIEELEKELGRIRDVLDYLSDMYGTDYYTPAGVLIEVMHARLSKPEMVEP
jgi:hypothetical protein